MKSSRRSLVTLVCAAVLVAGAAFAAQAGSGATGKSAANGGSITVWLSGIKARYEKTYPGSKVTFVLTPINNAQFTAQIAAAFASKRVPDAMLVYSGGYTTPYMLSSLEKLNTYVDGTPGFYKTQTAWDLSCLGLDCKGGKGDIYAIPNDQGTYGLFYNKALFAKAGVAGPPKT